MALIIYLMKKNIITNQQKSRVLLMAVMYYMKVKVIKDAGLSIDEYFDIIRPYLKDMIDSHKSKGEWKI